MALLAIYAGFDSAAVDLGFGYRQTHTATSESGGSTDFSFPPLQFGSTSIQIPSHVLSYDSAVDLSSATATLEGVTGSGLTRDVTGALTGGTVTGFAIQPDGNVLFGIVGISTSAADFAAAAQTIATADDAALFSGMLAGNDVVAVVGSGNHIDAGAGQDLIHANVGGNNLAGGNGADVIMGSPGNDTISGGAGKDILLGGMGRDHLSGGAGADLIWAGAGSGTMIGGRGADHFLFASGDGPAVIQDFQAGVDHLVFMGSLAERGAVAITQVGADTQVTFDGVTVTLKGFDHLSSHVTVGINGDALLGTAVTDFFTGWDYVA